MTDFLGEAGDEGGDFGDAEEAGQIVAKERTRLEETHQSIALQQFQIERLTD